MERKAEWTNKWNDKQEDSDSLLHGTTSHNKNLYSISQFLTEEAFKIEMFDRH